MPHLRIGLEEPTAVALPLSQSRGSNAPQRMRMMTPIPLLCLSDIVIKRSYLDAGIEAYNFYKKVYPRL